MSEPHLSRDDVKNQPQFLRSDLCCPECGADLEGYACTGCGTAHQIVLGVPFIGRFEADDTLGLIEIAANAPNRAHLGFSSDQVERIDALCRAYHVAEDRIAFKAQNSEANEGWFPNRYAEWLEVETLSADLDLKGKRVLDIGAGLGFDAHRLHLKGAEVTALEFSPILAEAGQRSFPDLRWIGGFAHALPFKNGSFDAIFCNAALHHMKDIPAAIAEGMRVLRPGGVMITTCDSFRSDGSSWRNELSVFDRDESVLLGVNEQIPELNAFLKTALSNPDLVDLEVFTHVLYGGRTGREADLHDFVRWEKTDLSWLRQRSGALAMRLTLKAAWPHTQCLQTKGVLAPALFASWLDDQSVAISEVAKLLPAEFVDTRFPGSGTKFELLNGWRRPRWFWRSRQGYKRARWFLRRDSRDLLSFEIDPGQDCDFSVLVAGQTQLTKRCGPGWQRLDVPIGLVERGTVYCVEIRRETKSTNFEEGCFWVRGRRLSKLKV